MVSPNNPTGSRLSAGELDTLAALCERHGLALIGDEVFAEYTLNDVAGAAGSGSGQGDGGKRGHVSVLSQRRALTFGLGGLSKSIGLPQVKLGWMGVGGPDALVEAALDRLDLIADTYLSVSTPVQLAAPLLIERGQACGRQSRRGSTRTCAPWIARLRARQAARCSIRKRAGRRCSACRRRAPKRTLVLDLLEEDRVSIMPGYFYDFPREAYLVVSLLPDPAVFNEAVARVLARAEAEPRV